MADPNESPGGIVIFPQELAPKRIDSCTLTNGSATVLDTQCLATDVGAEVDGKNIPIGVTILSVTAGTSFVMSANALGSGTEPVSIHPQLKANFSGGGYPTMPAVPSAGAFGYAATADSPLYGSATHTGSGGGSGTISDLTSTGGTITITNPTGPTTNLEVTNSGGSITTIESTDGSLTVTGGTGPTANIVLTNPVTEGLSVNPSSSSTALTVQNSGTGAIFVAQTSVGAGLTVDTFGHVVLEGTNTGVIAAGTQVATVVSSSSNDQFGRMRGTTVTTPVAGTVFVVTFHASLPTTPAIVLTPGDASSAAAQLYISAFSSTGFTVSSVLALPGSTAITVFFQVSV